MENIFYRSVGNHAGTFGHLATRHSDFYAISTRRTRCFRTHTIAKTERQPCVRMLIGVVAKSRRCNDPRYILWTTISVRCWLKMRNFYDFSWRYYFWNDIAETIIILQNHNLLSFDFSSFSSFPNTIENEGKYRNLLMEYSTVFFLIDSSYKLHNNCQLIWRT